MRIPHVMCIAPYEGMYEIMQNIAAHRSDVKMSVYLGDMEEGVAIVRKHVDEDIDVIVSRGRTGSLLSSNFLFPVCNITFSPYDILRAIQAALELTSHFAILGPRSLMENANLLCDSLQYNNVLIETITDTDDLRERLINLKSKGCTLVVGDRITVDTAKRLGMLHILITSGENSIQDAINQAVRLCQFGETTRQRALLMERVLRNDDRIVFLFDAQDQCLFSTQDAVADDFQRLAESCLEDVRKQKSLNRTVCEDSQYYSVQAKILSIENGIEYPVVWIYPFAPKAVTATALSVHNRSELEETERHFFWGRSDKITSFLEMAVRSFNVSQRLFLTGTQESEIFELAAYLHLHSDVANLPLICLDCSKITARQWSFYLESSDSPFYRNELSLFLRRADSLNEKQRMELQAFFESSVVGSRLNLIVSCHESQASKLAQQGLVPGFMRLQIPTLREHAEDIGEIASLYINQMGFKHGKQVIGLSADALRFLQEYTPLDSIAVLKQCLRAVVLMTESAYISVQDLEFILQQECPLGASKSDMHNLPIELNRPLKDIKRDIIQTVYEQTNMNQAKTARILGISRSTLWRVLGQDVHANDE